MGRLRTFLQDVSRRDFWVGLGLALVTVGIVWGTAIGTAKINESELALTCRIVRAQNVQLAALEQVRNELGLPGDLPIPEVPPECDGH